MKIASLSLPIYLSYTHCFFLISLSLFLFFPFPRSLRMLCHSVYWRRLMSCVSVYRMFYLTERLPIAFFSSSLFSRVLLMCKSGTYKYRKIYYFPSPQRVERFVLYFSKTSKVTSSSSPLFLQDSMTLGDHSGLYSWKTKRSVSALSLNSKKK